MKETFKTIMLFGGWLIPFGVFLQVMKTDPVQEWMDPQRFWSERVKSREGLVDFYRRDYAECVSDLRMSVSAAGKRTFALRHQAEGGASDDLARAYLSDVQVRQRVCEAWGEALKKYEQEVEGAKAKLASMKDRR